MRQRGCSSTLIFVFVSLTRIVGDSSLINTNLDAELLPRDLNLQLLQDNGNAPQLLATLQLI